MKSRLFFFAILILLAIISFQTYAKYATLKSIDSYESCISAKDSSIQESYPATCVTQLGKKFNAPTTPYVEPQPKYYWKEFSFELPEDWHRSGGDNPVSYYNYDETEMIRPSQYISGRDKDKLKIETYISEKDQTLEDFYNEYYLQNNETNIILKKNINLNGQVAILEETESQMGGNTTFVFVKNPKNGNIYHIVFALDFYNHKNLRDQILSTFHFLD